MRSRPFYVMCVLAVSVVGWSAAEEPQLDLASVVANVRRSEQQLRNAYVEAETRTEVADYAADKPPAWTKSPEIMRVRASFNGAIGGPYRLEVLQNVVPWTDGPKGKTPYGIEAYDSSYDGVREVTVRKADGHVDEPFDPRQATIKSGSGNPDPDLVFGSGAFFTNGFGGCDKTVSAQILSLDAALKEYAQSQPFTTITREKLDGRDVVKLAMGYRNIMEYRWWFAPSCGWAMVASEHLQGNPGRTDTRAKVTDLAEVAPGVWYPRAATREVLSPDSEKKVRRCFFHLQKIIVNSPEAEKHMKGGVIPAGTTVTDKIEGKVYETAPPDNQMQKQIEADLQKAAQAATQATEGK